MENVFLWYAFIGRHRRAQKTDFDNGKIYFWAKAMSPNESILLLDFLSQVYTRETKAIGITGLLPPERTSLLMMSYISNGRVKHNHRLQIPNRNFQCQILKQTRGRYRARARVWLVADRSPADVIPLLRLVSPGFTLFWCCVFCALFGLFIMSSHKSGGPTCSQQRWLRPCSTRRLHQISL